MKRTANLIQNKRILITGGGGFIGGQLTNSLEKNNEIVIFDDFHRDETRNLQNTAHVTYVNGTVLDSEALHAAMERVDIVVHCAAVVGINTVGKLPIRTLDVNIKGSANVLDAAALHESVQQVVCFSTSEIYGEYAVNVSEDDPASIGSPDQMRWMYALSKLAEEFYASANYVQRGLPVTILRPFNVFGPGQIGDGAIKTFIAKALKNEPIEIVGDGLQIRSWCYIQDFVTATNLALGNDKSIGQTFNIGNPTNTVTIEFLAQTIIRLVGSSSKIHHIPAAKADVYVRIPDISKAREYLDYQPEIGLEEGILRTIESFTGS